MGFFNRRPVDPLGQLVRPEVDQVAAPRLTVLTTVQLEPVHLVLGRIDDQNLVDIVSRASPGSIGRCFVRDPLSVPAATLAARQGPMAERLELGLELEHRRVRTARGSSQDRRKNELRSVTELGTFDARELFRALAHRDAEYVVIGT
jgi:hypothetical protein